MAMVLDLVLLIDEVSAVVLGGAVNQRLSDAFCLARAGEPGEAAAVLRAGRDEVSGRLVGNTPGVEKAAVMVGRGACVLYQALAGRAYGSRPSDYSSTQLCDVARCARAHVLRRRGKNEAWALAWRCVQAQGEEVRPWLATLVVDADGVPVKDSPLYETRLLLSGGIWLG